MPRGRKPNIEPSAPLHLSLPEALRLRLDLLLFSEVESRVPKGAYMSFFTRLLTSYFEHRELDLAPYVSSLPGERVVRGSPETIAALEAALQAKQQGIPQ